MSSPGYEATGYLHPLYARSFAEVATPRELPECGGWILERNVPGSASVDAMGCWPVFACRDWRGLAADLARVDDRLVSLTLVTDPFGTLEECDLHTIFDVVHPYKQHQVVDMELDPLRALPRRHRRNLARAGERVVVEECSNPAQHLDEWVEVYSHLAARHGISGITAFSRRSFEMQLRVPGLVMLRAMVDGELAGIHLWYVQRGVGYGHLGATTALGYEVAAAYALYAHAIEWLRGHVRWLDLGGAPGLDDASGEGLVRFKRGWATGTRPVFLCGKVFQPERYAELVRECGAGGSRYFPAYRGGEFADPAGDAEPTGSG